MGEPFGKFTVVGEHKHSGGSLVKSSYRIYPCGASFQEVHYGFFCVRVTDAGDISLGLVHHEVNLLFAFETLTVEADFVVENVYLCSKFGYHFAVDRDYTCLNHSVGLSAGANARIGYELVEAYFFLNHLGDLSGRNFPVELGPAADHTVDSVFR